MANLNSLQDLFVEQLQDLYDAEQQLTEALPKMAKAASNPQLQQAFTSHLKETQGHVDRLAQVFQIIGKKATRKTCKAMKGLVEEGSEAIKEDAVPEVKDAALISAGNRVEHYEIAGYGTVRTFAEELGFTDAARLLQQTLNEEVAADQKLTQIAERRVNRQAQ